MARVIDAKHSTLIGTPEQLLRFLQLLGGKRSAVADLKYSKFIVLKKPLTKEQLKQALATGTKRRTRKRKRK